MKASGTNDNRILKILKQLVQFSGGDFSGRISISEKEDEIDKIAKGINTLGETLRKRIQETKEGEDRINSLLEILSKYTAMDFSAKAKVGGTNNEIDALSSGLNTLGEELAYHTAELKDSEEQIKTIFKNAPDAVVVIDSKGIIVRWNPAAEMIFGWREKDVVGKTLHSILIPERYRKNHIAGIDHFLKTGEGPVLNKTIQLPALHKNNTEIEIELTISPAKLKDEYIFISFLRDITERKKADELITRLNATLEQRVHERTEQLYESEKKYRNLFENNPMPMWVLELPSLRFMDINESAIRQYGYSREEFLSMTALDIRPEDEKKRFLELDRSETTTKNTGIWKHVKKDGALLYAEVSVHRIIFNGKAARLVLSNDITERKKAEEALRFSEARFRRIFDSKLIGFLFWNTSGEITEANDFFLEDVGYTREDLYTGKIKWDELTPPEYSNLDKLALDQIKATGTCEPYEKELIRKNGSRLPVLIGAADITQDATETRVAYIMDISQRKKMQEEILELNRDLEQRITKRTEQLQTVNSELEAFSYSVSHDLRAPLRAIHGYSQMLLEDYQSRLDKEAIRLINTVRSNAKRMGQLVDDLLEFSRMGKLELTTTHIDMNNIVQRVLNELNHSDGKTKIVVHPLGYAKADYTLLGHVFQNLIQNAIKYSSKKEDPMVEIGTTEINGAKTYFVKDNGAGFDMAYYDKLFGVFQRLHRHDEFEGTGVGLAIVQRIVNRHGGQVWADAKVNEGATFYFTLNNPDNN